MGRKGENYFLYLRELERQDRRRTADDQRRDRQAASRERRRLRGILKDHIAPEKLATMSLEKLSEAVARLPKQPGTPGASETPTMLPPSGVSPRRRRGAAR